jgi:hypothetical protein
MKATLESVLRNWIERRKSHGHLANSSINCHHTLPNLYWRMDMELPEMAQGKI